MITKLLILFAVLLLGCTQESKQSDSVQFDTVITVDSNVTFVTPGISEIYLGSKSVFRVTTLSGAFDFSTCEVSAKCIGLIDFTIINYNQDPIDVVVMWKE